MSFKFKRHSNVLKSAIVLFVICLPSLTLSANVKLLSRIKRVPPPEETIPTKPTSDESPQTTTETFTEGTVATTNANSSETTIETTETTTTTSATTFSTTTIKSQNVLTSISTPIDLLQTEATTFKSSVEGRTRACNVLVGIDEILYEHYDKNMTNLVAMVKEHFEFVNKIFADQVFDEDSDFSDVYFHVDRVQVFFGTCDALQDKNCTTQRHEYLKYFDKHDFADFCLAYMFTYIDFFNGTTGFASLGTVCRPINNSGFVTLVNHGIDSDLESSGLTFAHELGHSFGASHDNDTENEECVGKGYIMTPLQASESGNNENHLKFSPCSIEQMKSKTLSQIGYDIDDCFKSGVQFDPNSEPVISICGNEILEAGEECDCGMEVDTCHDPCCYPAHISDDQRYYNESALPCMKKDVYSCSQHPGLVYGIYVPFGFIGTCVIILAIILRQDWHGNKKFFDHVTHGNIRIVHDRS